MKQIESIVVIALVVLSVLPLSALAQHVQVSSAIQLTDDLEEVGAIKISVVNKLDSGQSEVLKDAKVIVYTKEGNLVEAKSTESGSAVFELQEGKYYAIATWQDKVSDKMEFSIEAGDRESLVISFEAPDFTIRPGVLEVTVVSEGKVSEDAKVVVYDQKARIVATELSGRARFELPEGKYVVTAEHPELGSAKENVKVEAHQTTAIRLVLASKPVPAPQTFGKLTVSIVDDNGNAIPQAFAVVFRVDKGFGIVPEGMGSADAQSEVSGPSDLVVGPSLPVQSLNSGVVVSVVQNGQSVPLASGNYLIQSVALGYSPDIQRVKIQAGQSAVVTAKLAKGAEIQSKEIAVVKQIDGRKVLEKVEVKIRELEENKKEVQAGDVKAKTQLQVKIEGEKLVTEGQKKKEIILPDQALEKVKEKAKVIVKVEVELKESGEKAIYEVKVTEKKNFLGFIPLDIQNVYSVDAETGDVEKSFNLGDALSIAIEQ